jgi:hypothetical protein
LFDVSSPDRHDDDAGWKGPSAGGKRAAPIGLDDLREIAKLFTELLRDTPGVGKLASATSEVGTTVKATKRASGKTREAVAFWRDFFTATAWAMSTAFRFARAASRAGRR